MRKCVGGGQEGVFAESVKKYKAWVRQLAGRTKTPR